MSAQTNGPGSQLWRAVGPKAKVTVVLGAQWGDEGKGKLVDILSTDADVVCRCQVRIPEAKKILRIIDA